MHVWWALYKELISTPALSLLLTDLECRFSTLSVRPEEGGRTSLQNFSHECGHIPPLGFKQFEAFSQSVRHASTKFYPAAVSNHNTHWYKCSIKKKTDNVFLYRSYCTEIIVAFRHGLQKLTTPARNFPTVSQVTVTQFNGLSSFKLTDHRLRYDSHVEGRVWRGAGDSWL